MSAQSVQHKWLGRFLVASFLATTVVEWDTLARHIKTGKESWVNAQMILLFCSVSLMMFGLALCFGSEKHASFTEKLFGGAGLVYVVMMLLSTIYADDDANFFVGFDDMQNLAKARVALMIINVILIVFLFINGRADGKAAAAK
jgi:hypothetical protein